MVEERSQLSRTLKPQWVWAIALGSAIGWGAFVQPTAWLGDAGPLGAILGFSIGAVLMMIIAVSYGFMVNNFPVSGGEFAYAFLGFGRNHAYVAGWFLVLGYICIVALNASALGLLGKYVLPEIAEIGFLYSLAGWDVFLGEVALASAALLLVAYLNIRGATISGRMQFIFVLVMITGVVLMAAGMLFHPDTSFSNLQPAFNPEIPAWSAVIAIVAIAPWAFVGFDNIPQTAEEFNFPPKKAFMLIIFSLIGAGLIYVLMIAATAMAMPWQDLVSGQPEWGTGDVISGLFGRLGLLVLSVSLMMGIFTGLNGFYVASSRLLFAMGRAQIIPSAFAKLHPRYQTPYLGIIFTCIVCLIAPWFGREVITWIVDMSATGVTIAYIYTCVVAYRLFSWSRDGDSLKKSQGLSGTVAPAKKIFSFMGFSIGFLFLGLLLIPGSPAFMGAPSWIALIVWCLLGLIFYLIKGPAFRRIPEQEMRFKILGSSRGHQDSDK